MPQIMPVCTLTLLFERVMGSHCCHLRYASDAASHCGLRVSGRPAVLSESEPGQSDGRAASTRGPRVSAPTVCTNNACRYNTAPGTLARDTTASTLITTCCEHNAEPQWPRVARAARRQVQPAAGTAAPAMGRGRCRGRCRHANKRGRCRHANKLLACLARQHSDQTPT